MAGLLLPVSSFPMAGTIQNEPSGLQVHHEIKLVDPLYPSEPECEYSLTLSFDDQGFPCEYSLSLQAEVCLGQVCNRVDATLFWDALGRFQRLEVPLGVPLTKLDHIPFGKKDSIRLDEILKDTGSILGNYPVGFFQGSEFRSDQVDGVSAATPIAVRNAVVEGAAYTTWVLWHWVNGEVVNELHALTALHATSGYLESCLLSGDPGFVRFALEYILENAMQDLQYRDACFQILETGKRDNCRFALQYLTDGSMGRVVLHRRLVELIGINPGSSRLILEYFETQPDLDPGIMEQMAEQFDRLSPYDLYAVLNVLETHSGNNGMVRERVSKLLDSDNAYVVRCAQEFLDRADE